MMAEEITATEVMPVVVADQDDPFSYLIASGQLSLDALARARRLAAEAGERVAATLTRLGHVSEHDMANAFAQALGLRLVKATVLSQDTVPFSDLSPAFLRQARVARRHAVPVGAAGGGDEREL
jgi:hypothetical protein